MYVRNAVVRYVLYSLTLYIAILNPTYSLRAVGAESTNPAPRGAQRRKQHQYQGDHIDLKPACLESAPEQSMTIRPKRAGSLDVVKTLSIVWALRESGLQDFTPSLNPEGSTGSRGLIHPNRSDLANSGLQDLTPSLSPEGSRPPTG